VSVITFAQYAKTRTDQELITEARALYNSIYRMDNYDVKSWALLEALQNELVKRGYKLQETSELVIIK